MAILMRDVRRWLLFVMAATFAAGCSESRRSRIAEHEDDDRIEIEHARYDDRQRDTFDSDRTDDSRDDRMIVRRASDVDRDLDVEVRRTSSMVEPAGPEPTTIDEQRARTTEIMHEPPPPLRAEVPPREPRDGEFWVPGHWRAEGGQYVWEPGRLERLRPGRLYGGAYWIETERGWEYSPEYWR